MTHQAPGPVTIRQYRPSDAEALDRLNERLEAGGVEHKVWPGDLKHREAPPQTGPRKSRLLVAAGANEMHGGVWLAEQDFSFRGESKSAGWVKYPVSESLVNPECSGIPGSMLFALMREQPLLMALGLGGHGSPFARLLERMKWSGSTIPFFFRFERPFRVLRELRFARRSRVRALALDIAAFTGLGPLGYRVLSAFRRLGSKGPRPDRNVSTTVEPVFGAWTDELWNQCRGLYGMMGNREAATLNDAYPAGYQGLTRLRIQREGKDLGWVCVLSLDLRAKQEDRYFGPLMVGVITDGLSRPEDAATVLAAGAEYLRKNDVDLIITNQSHLSWREGLKAAGFFEGPSNFAFYRSPRVEAALAGATVTPDEIHITRGDCDGPRWI